MGTEVEVYAAGFYSQANLIVAPVPQSIILGLDWLKGLLPKWNFDKSEIVVEKGKYVYRIPMMDLRVKTVMEGAKSANVDEARVQGREAHEQLASTVQQLGPQAAALIRKQAKRYKNFKTKAKRIPIKEIVRDSREKKEKEIEKEECTLMVARPGDEKACGDWGRHEEGREKSVERSESTYEKLEEWLRDGETKGRVLSFLYRPTVTSILDYWKNHSLD